MKTYKLQIVFLGLFIWANSIVAQSNKEDNPEFKSYSSSVFDSKNATLSVVSEMDKKDQKKLNQNLQSGVLIQQIGNYNSATTLLKSQKTKVEVNQLGDNNDFLLVKNAKSITQSGVQQGSGNKVVDFTLYTHRDVNIKTIQNGNNNEIKNFGTNSLSDNLKITQKGNGAEVILINK